MTSEHCQRILNDVTICRHLAVESTFFYSVHPDMMLLSSTVTALQTLLEVCIYTLSCRIGKVVASHAAVARSSPAEVCTDEYHASGAQGVLLMRVGGATSQLDLPSLTPLSVAGCG